MKTIPLNSGYEVLVDDADYEELSKYSWYIHLPSLIVTKRSGGILMSREIMNAPSHLEVDHKNGDKLDMQRFNLRLCTHSQNSQNRRKIKKKTSSKYKGVSFVGKWRANIWLPDILGQSFNRYLGRFLTEEAAAKAYDSAARLHFKEFACLNFPEKGERSCLE